MPNIESDIGRGEEGGKRGKQRARELRKGEEEGGNRRKQGARELQEGV